MTKPKRCIALLTPAPAAFPADEREAEYRRSVEEYQRTVTRALAESLADADIDVRRIAVPGKVRDIDHADRITARECDLAVMFGLSSESRAPSRQFLAAAPKSILFLTRDDFMRPIDALDSSRGATYVMAESESLTHLLDGLDPRDACCWLSDAGTTALVETKHFVFERPKLERLTTRIGQSDRHDCSAKATAEFLAVFARQTLDSIAYTEAIAAAETAASDVSRPVAIPSVTRLSKTSRSNETTRSTGKKSKSVATRKLTVTAAACLLAIAIGSTVIAAT